MKLIKEMAFLWIYSDAFNIRLLTNHHGYSYCINLMTANRPNNPQLKWVDRISRLMDSKFTIPGTSIKFGLDPVLGLLPGVGDLGTYGVSLTLIYTMYRHGASSLLIARMVVNATIDAIFGSIPILGALFDLWFKANNRNVKLLREYYEEGKHRGSGKAYLISVILIAALVIIGLIYLTIKVIAAILDLVF